jgi:ceramide glucosyltransferase
MLLVFLILAAAALVYQLLALFCLWRFFSQPQPVAATSPAPGITVLKPLKGLEAGARACLESFFTQAYPHYQLIFGLADPNDPVLPLLRQLQQFYPQVHMEIILCPQVLGLNPKVSTLRQLEPHIRHDLVVVADGDVRVGGDFLARLASALQAPGLGLVSCPYRAGASHSLGAILEALSISGDFIPSVTVAWQVEGIRFALGAAMGLSRLTLQRLGGFAALADFLADDYQLGWQVHQTGRQVCLLPYVVETHNPDLSFQDYFSHQLRWSRTYRVCRPGGYLAFGISQALVWSLAVCLAAGGAAFAWALVGAALLIRWGVAVFSERFCLQGPLTGAAFLLLPLKDLLAFVLWLLSFFGRRITWKGEPFRLTPEGKLVKIR